MKRAIVYIWDSDIGGGSFRDVVGLTGNWRDFPEYTLNPNTDEAVKLKGKHGQAILIEYTGEGDKWEIIRRIELLPSYSQNQFDAFMSDGYGSGTGVQEPVLKLGLPGLTHQFGAGLGPGAKQGNWLLVLIIILLGMHLMEQD